MNHFKTKIIECDLLIIGGGMAGCGAVFEASYWGKNLRIVMVEKAAVERSGATGEGLSAINCFLGKRWGWNTPEDYLEYVKNDMMGVAREDLVYDIGRHVDGSVHLFESWGLPICKDSKGEYLRIGRWQIAIHGESIKPIIAAETTSNLKEKGGVYERILITHLLRDANDPERVAGAIGFSVRESVLYVFKAQAILCTAGGASNIFRPKSVGEGLGRNWYSLFDTGSVYGLLIPIGAEMTQMEHRFVPTRFKDGYGPVGMWFQLFKAKPTNAYGEDYTITRADALKKYEPYASAIPTPTPLRNHQIYLETLEGKGPIYLKPPKMSGTKDEIEKWEASAWESFLDMTISQAIVWASQNITPEEGSPEIVMAEPYIMGSHSGEAGAWVSGAADLSSGDYFWGYNRMTTIKGLFTAGDGVGAAPHKFSSGSFTEGRIAAKAAVAYIMDHPEAPVVAPKEYEALQSLIERPFEIFRKYFKNSTNEEINPDYLLPKQGLMRLQKIMDEYAAGISATYRTNKPTLEKGLELLTFLREDLERLGARDLHELMRCWELVHRTWTAEAHVRHLLYREETRWPGYYYRTDYPELNEKDWHVFVNSRYDSKTNHWSLSKQPCISL